MYSVYILQSLKDGSFYVGQTKDLEERIKRHSDGHAKYTRLHLPYILLHSEKFSTRAGAVRREKQIKSYKGGIAFKKLIKYLK